MERGAHSHVDSVHDQARSYRAVGLWEPENTLVRVLGQRGTQRPRTLFVTSRSFSFILKRGD